MLYFKIIMSFICKIVSAVPLDLILRAHYENIELIRNMRPAFNARIISKTKWETIDRPARNSDKQIPCDAAERSRLSHFGFATNLEIFNDYAEA